MHGSSDDVWLFRLLTRGYSGKQGQKQTGTTSHQREFGAAGELGGAQDGSTDGARDIKLSQREQLRQVDAPPPPSPPPGPILPCHRPHPPQGSR